jgi:hypothetical protein
MKSSPVGAAYSAPTEPGSFDVFIATKMPALRAFNGMVSARHVIPNISRRGRRDDDGACQTDFAFAEKEHGFVLARFR